MKVLSLFSGIGAFEKALERLNINYELVGYCEIDKYASKSYSLIHGVDESLNLGDITKVDATELPNDIDLLCYGFPCQDISLSGKMRGFEHEGERTRSGLFSDELPSECDLNLLINEKTKKGYAVATDGDGIYIDRPHQKRGVVQKGMIPTLKTTGKDIGVVVMDEHEK